MGLDYSSLAFEVGSPIKMAKRTRNRKRRESKRNKTSSQMRIMTKDRSKTRQRQQATRSSRRRVRLRTGSSFLIRALKIRIGFDLGVTYYRAVAISGRRWQEA